MEMSGEFHDPAALSPR